MKYFLFMFALCGGLLFGTSAAAYGANGQNGDINNAQTVQQKKYIVSGIVTDANGIPLIGATVSASGTANGVITDLNGRYSIKVSGGDAKLTFTYVGYVTITKSVGVSQTINVVMHEDSKSLDEVVVVGYGVQKRRDLVGAVDQIKGNSISERGNMYATKSLQGMMPGLNITASDGKPTHGGTIDIRGAGSIGSGGSALVMIDGAEGDITTVNPRDIESVSVLKDASSAAIYGARGAFGVILITTKKPKTGKVEVTYNGSVSALQRVFKPQIESDALIWTNNFITSYQNAKGGIYPNSVNNVFNFSQDYYDELVKRHNDPTLEKQRTNSAGRYEYFGNTNWLDLIYKDWTYATEHNVSVSGGSEKASFFVSGRYWGQDGIYDGVKENYSQYNFRAKGSIKINKWFTFEDNSDVIRRVYRQPMVMYDNQNITRQIEQQGYPMTMEKNLDGTWTEVAVYTGWAGFKEGTSFQKNYKFDWQNTATLTYQPFKELIVKGDYTYRYERARRIRENGLYTYWNGPAISGQRNTFSSLDHLSIDREYMASNVTANYIPTFKNKDHSLNLLVGWNLETYSDNEDGMYRRGLLYQNYPSYALMDGDYYTLGQDGTSWGYVGLMYRANYSYKDRYLFEFSGRYDGSSKFPKNQKWGFFPSGSVGWRISNEPFMKATNHWLDNLKVRFSIGSLGNGNIDPYKYLSLMGTGRTSAIIDGALQAYASVPTVIPDNLSWETSTTYDFGVDFDMLQNRLSFCGDLYARYTRNMYTVGPELPDVFGASAPKGNYANMKTPGVELSLSWRDQFNLLGKPFKYSIKAMYWDSYSTVTKYNNPNKSLSVSSYYNGARLGDIWGFHVEGLFKDQADIDNHANQSGYFKVSDDGVWRPGDLKFGDLDNSQTIDRGENTVAKPGDRKIIGNTTPRYRFGLNLGAEWQNFTLSAFFQGVGKRDWYPHIESAFFWGQYNRPYSYDLKDQDRDRYTAENQNVNAYWPLLRSYSSTSSTKEMGTANDRYIQNAAYIRLKNLSLGYAFNPSFCHKFGLERLSLVLTAENLWTYSPMFKHTKNFDPENLGAGDDDFRSTAGTDGDGYGYPSFRTFTFGINVAF